MNLPNRLPEVPGATDRRPFAVIDIGSNSVRMVVYEALKRAALPIFNEKVLCGLGRGVRTSGRLDPEAAELALQTLRRYASLAKAMGVGAIEAVATAAIRDSADGQSFIDRVQEHCGIGVRVLSGAEEGHYSALGVAAAIPAATGLVGDLGGGSLELVRLKKGQPGRSTTLPLGALRYDAGAPDATEIDKVLGTADWLADEPKGKLYCVGGVWRSIARIHIRQHRAPLQIVHGYRVSSSDIVDLCVLLGRMGPSSLAAMEGVPSKRVGSIPVGARVLERLVTTVQPSSVVFCGYGLREGLVQSHLDPEEQQRDPFLTFCEEEAKRSARFPIHVDELLDWMAPVLGDPGRDALRLRRGAILLSELAWRGHPDYRAEQALVRILHAPFVGIGLRGRALIALAVYERYRGDQNHSVAVAARRLLGDDEVERAETLGRILNLAHTLSGGAPKLLPRTSLVLSDRSLTLSLPQDLRDFAGEAVQKRHARLARHLGVQPEVVAAG